MRNLIGHIISRLEKAGFDILDMKMNRLTKDKAHRFYTVHEGKPFLDDLTEYMSSGMIVPMMLEKDNTIDDLRALIGATDPVEASCGTLRQETGLDKQKKLGARFRLSRVGGL